jgi:hypothetical protein
VFPLFTLKFRSEAIVWRPYLLCDLLYVNEDAPVGQPEKSANGRDYARELLEDTGKLFESEANRRAIDEQSIETHASMLKNETSHPSTDQDGLAPRVEKPWWPIADLSVVYTIKEKIQREDHLRWRAFDHSLVAFMYGLARRGIIPKLSAFDIEALLNGGTHAILYETSEATRLQKLTAILGNGKGKMGAVRDNYVIPLARLRLLQYHDIPGRGSFTGYGIKASYAAMVFIERVYAPVVAAMDIKYQPPSP